MLQPRWYETRNIIVLLPSSTPLMPAYRKAVEDFFLTTSHGINRDISFSIYRKAWAEAYTIEKIKAEFKVTGIFPISSRVVLNFRNLLPKAIANPGLIPPEYLKIPITPSTAFSRKLSSLSN